MFPSLTRLLELMGHDSDMTLKKSPEWPPEVLRLEELASKLRADGVDDLEKYHGEYEYENEFEIMAIGELDDIERLTESKRLRELNEFLAECFDGDLNRRMFEE